MKYPAKNDIDNSSYEIGIRKFTRRVSKVDYKFSVASANIVEKNPLIDMSQSHCDEYALDLPGHWKLIGNENGRIYKYHTQEEDATIIVSVEVFENQRENNFSNAERNINSQIQFYREKFPETVELLRWLVRPHSKGNGVEMSYVVKINEQQAFMYFGYMTSRKMIGLLMISAFDQNNSIHSFIEALKRFRVKDF